jgi:hypothetical protein
MESDWELPVNGNSLNFGYFCIMYKIVMLCCCSLILFFSCKQKGNQQAAKKTTDADTAKFYPIDVFVKDQMQQVDLGDYQIRKLFTSDSSESNETIDKATFLGEAATVLSSAKQFVQNKTSYRESVFQDLSTASYTINYTAIDASISIQRVDVLLSEETNIIKRLLIREQININGEAQFRQINWLANHGFQISSPSNINGKLITERTDISWNKAIK